jgi:gliding motility-associated-like protein
MVLSKAKRLFSVIFVLCVIGSFSQNEQSKWYFGNYAALDFMNSPPTPLLNSAMNAPNSCASQADKNGNILFYTNGLSVYNSSHVVMANGSGLAGTNFSFQGNLIVPKPGTTNLYYMFTVKGNNTANGLNYSVVDMNLAAGQGSVITKNTLLDASEFDEKICGTRHCNGIDYWVVVKKYNDPNFYSYKVTAAGVNTVAVKSPVAPVGAAECPMAKFSPSGNKLASIHWNGTSNFFLLALYDFDNTTGIVSNRINLFDSIIDSPIGLEFSPDCSKLYCVDNTSSLTDHFLYQWDICAGSAAAMVNSRYKIPSTLVYGCQLAIDDKIYVSTSGSTAIHVINNPNMPGAACSYSQFAQTLGGKWSMGSLPNFITQYKTAKLPFTFSLSPSVACNAITFTANLAPISCAASNYSVSSVKWDFGDVASTFSNTSTSLNPHHIYPSSGTYDVKLILQYKCGSDTISGVVNVPPPDISVTWSANCNNTASATVLGTGGLGPYTFSWMPSGHTVSIVSNLAAGNHTVSLTDHGLGCNVSTVVSITTKSAPAIWFSNTAGLTYCSSKSATIAIRGDSSVYSWAPSAGLFLQDSVLFVNAANSQQYTISAIRNGCNNTAVLQVNVLPLPTPIIISSGDATCINSLLKLQGIGGIQYQWEGPGNFLSSSQSFSRLVVGQEAVGLYTLTVTDVNGCKASTTRSVSVILPPKVNIAPYPKEGCVPFCSNFEIQNSEQQPSIVSKWVLNGRTFSDDFTYCFDIARTHTVTGFITDTATSCTNTVFLFVDAFAPPKADFYYVPEKPLDNGETVTFFDQSLGPDQTRWTWYFRGEETTRLTGESVSHSYSEAGTFLAIMVVESKHNCSDTVIKKIAVEEDFALYVPNSFSPNSDNRNDLFAPVTRGVKKYVIRIFNRWGQLVFEGTEKGFGWDGLNNDHAFSADTYVWTIDATTLKGQNVHRKGHLLLTR